MKLEFSCFRLILIIVFLKYVKLVPDEYCLSPLNRSDCGTPPTPVFSYFKYGSRCEIETWRGCPTDNMFENEYHCSHYCIGKTKYYGRERGSWKRKVRISIEHLSFNELEEIQRIVNKIDITIESKEMLSLKKRPKIPNKTTVKVIEDTDKGTTVEASEENMDEITTVEASEENMDEITLVEASKEDMDETAEEYGELDETTLVFLTQEPVTGTYVIKGEILKFKRNKNNSTRHFL
ncbi:uncharacterized protein LOC133521133 [Cydia pomonella]|uniref:uncharacterized protein LOC133521133 n=1 Tax=Cydia pomonella TaxID=82600 RepID=UPI002ADE6A48|nr:uncharacterized protein LOC133521133 [Cydia pomonella]